MSTPEDSFGPNLRQLLLEASTRITPSKPAPTPGTFRPAKPNRRITTIIAIVAVCALVAAAVSLLVAFGPRSQVQPGSGGSPAGEIVVARTDGTVQVLSLSNGSVIRTLVSPGTVDTTGHHLSRPYALTASTQAVYISYLGSSTSLNPLIEKVPVTGGTPVLVTKGQDAAVSHDGSELALFRPSGVSGNISNSTVTGSVIVRDLETGTEETVYNTTGISSVETLSWSSDGQELLISGLFYNPGVDNPSTSGPISAIEIGVQVLELDQPLSPENPRFVVPPTIPSEGEPGISDGQFIGPNGEIAAISLSIKSQSLCGPASTNILSLEPATGLTRIISTEDFAVSQVYFDAEGHLQAIEKDEPDCRALPTTTTTTTLSGPGPIKSIGTNGSASFSYASAARYGLEVHEAGGWTEIATDLSASALFETPTS